MTTNHEETTALSPSPMWRARGWGEGVPKSLKIYSHKGLHPPQIIEEWIMLVDSNSQYRQFLAFLCVLRVLRDFDCQSSTS